MNKEGGDNKWAEVDRIIGQGERHKHEEGVEARKSETKEELLTEDPEVLLAGIEADPKKLEVTRKGILEAQREYKRLAAGKNDEGLADIKWVWSKTIERLIEMLSK